MSIASVEVGRSRDRPATWRRNLCRVPTRWGASIALLDVVRRGVDAASTSPVRALLDAGADKDLVLLLTERHREVV
jgi:hypothetical protein